jgi:hypothetical protein
MTALQLAWKNLTRKGGPTFILIVSLALALGGASLLYRVYVLQKDRYESLATGPQAVVGAKASGIEILLGSMRLEDFNPGYIPSNLYQTVKRGIPLKFEDGTVVDSGQFVQRAIPILFVSKIGDSPVIATDKTMLDFLKVSPSALESQKVAVGSMLASENNLKAGDPIKLSLRSFTWFQKDFTIGAILPETNTVWDRAAFINLDEGQNWLLETKAGHPVWGPNVLHYFMIEMNMIGFPAIRSLINERSVSQLISVSEEREKLQNLIGAGSRVGLLVVSLILLLAGLAIGGMMNLRTEALRVSAAVLRAIGFPKSFVAKWLLYETMMIFFISFFLGLVVEWGLWWLVYPHLKSTLPTNPVSHLPAVFLVAPVWGAALIFAILGMCIPYLRLASQDVHQELK